MVLKKKNSLLFLVGKNRHGIGGGGGGGVGGGGKGGYFRLGMGLKFGR